MLDMKN